MKKTLFLAISMMVVSFAFGQQETFHELPNQDHTVFERGIGDTVYVLEEHVTYNLQTDQFGCTKKDSVVCKVLAGTLIVPPNYFQILKDSIKNKSQICDCIKNEINYLNLWQRRGTSYTIFPLTHVKRIYDTSGSFSTTDYYQTIVQTINENGKVSFVSKMIPVFSSSSSWWIWVSWFIVLLISILVTWLIFANEEFVIWQQVLRIAVQSFVLWFVLMLIMICVCNTPSKPMDNGALVYFEGFSVGVWVLILLGASVCFVTFTVLTFSLIEHLKKRESKR